jgi:hypothetical protein
MLAFGDTASRPQSGANPLRACIRGPAGIAKTDAGWFAATVSQAADDAYVEGVPPFQTSLS